jgi:hypothetical protein
MNTYTVTASFTEHDQTYIIYVPEPDTILQKKIVTGNLVVTPEKGDEYVSQLLLEIAPSCAIHAQEKGMHELHITERVLKELTTLKECLRTAPKYTLQFFHGTEMAKHQTKNLEEKFSRLKKQWEEVNLQNQRDVVT